MTAWSPRGLIGVVHLQALPGDPRNTSGSFDEAERAAMNDAEALARGGVDAIIIENFGSAPFSKGTEGHRIPPHQVAFLAIFARDCARLLGLPVGVNCLRNDAMSALGIAAAAGASFVRVNVHTGAYVTDQGLIEGEADRSLRYRASLGASGVRILADVLVKHAAPLAPLTVETAVHDCIDRGLADGVVVSGAATGAPVDVAVLREARAAAGSKPVLLGSGLTLARVDELVPLASGAIVGTSLKVGGQLHAPVDEGRVREMVAAVKGRFFGSA